MSVQPPVGPDIIEFATSRKFLGRGRDSHGELIGLPPLSPSQISILKAIYGLEMTREERLAFLGLTEGREPRGGGYTEAALVCGIRSGKTMLGALIGTYETVRWGPVLAEPRKFGVEPMLIPGQIATGIIIAQDKTNALTARSYIEGNFRTLEARGIQVLAKTEGQERAVTGKGIRTMWPVEIVIYPAKSASTRGITGLWFIGDEIAHWEFAEGAYNQDTKIMRAVRGRFLTLSRLRPKRLLISSPAQQEGVLFDVWKARDTTTGLKTLVVNAPSSTLNPDLVQADLDFEEEKDPEGYAQEYGARFEDEGGKNTFLPPEIVDSCVERGLHQRQRQNGVEYVAWLDAAFKKDRFGFGIGHLETGPGACRVLLDYLQAWTPQSIKGKKNKALNDDEIVKEIATVLRGYSTDRVHGDQFCDIPLQNKFKEHGIQFMLAPVSDPEKAEAFKNMKGAFRSMDVGLLDDEKTIKDLKGLVKTTTKTGHMRIAAPSRRGCYDDMANIVARIIQKLLPLNSQVDLAGANQSAMPDRGIASLLDWKQPAKDGDLGVGLMEAVY